MKGYGKRLVNNRRIKRMGFSLAGCHLIMPLLSTVMARVEKNDSGVLNFLA